jgi:iron complex transport system substrate-binding protein
MKRLFAAAVLLTGLAACSSPSTTPGPAATSAAPFPVTVGSITLDKRPERIVSLSPTATEMLFAVDAGAQVVAVDDFSTYPPSAPKTKLSGYKPNAEAIAAYRPDLVVISNDSEKIVDQLKALKIPTYLAPAAVTVDDTYKQITEIGQLTGHAGQSSAVNEQIKNDLAKLAKDLPARAAPLTYYYELDPTLFSLTSKTFVGSLFTAAGLTNIADAAGANNPYPQLSGEVIVKQNPDLIFLADTKCCGQNQQTVGTRAGWGGIAAVKNGQVVALDDDIASRWGPRIVDLFRAITEAAAKAPVS